MTTSHRTSSIQRPITGEVTRPTRRRRRPAADSTPGRGLPERPLPGRPGNVMRPNPLTAANPSTSRSQAARATVGRATTSPAARNDPPTEAMPLTEAMVRKAATDRRAEARRGSSRPGAAKRPPREARPLAVIGEASAARAARPASQQPGTRPARPAGEQPAKRAARRTGDEPATRSARPATDQPARRTARRTDEPAAPRARRSAAGEPATVQRRAARSERRARRADKSGPRQSPLRDVTRPIARDSRMAERRPVRIGYGLIATAIGLALVAALVVLPIRRWWNQRADLADRKSELDILREANAQLGDEVTALQTPEGIEAAARTDLNFGYPGEERTRSVGDPQAPMVLPAGFPYSLVSAILGARTNLAAASPNPAATVPADPAASGAPADSTVPPATEAPEPTIAPPPGNPLSAGP